MDFKRTLLYIIVLMCICCACGRRPYPPALLAADSLCAVAPDSAVALLQSLMPQMSQADEATRMYHRLLTVKAADKNYVTHTSDSLIHSVLLYYEAHHDHRHLPEAYYYAGRVYRDLGDAPQALDYFQKALDEMGEDPHSLKIKNKVYAQMGTLFSYQRIYDEALEYHQKSLSCDRLLGDTIGMILSLRDIAGEYWNQLQADSVLTYYQQAYDLALQLGQTRYIYMLRNQLASFYREIGKYDTAMQYIVPSANSDNFYSKSAAYSITAELYYKQGEIDSATYYYKELLDYGTIYARSDAHKVLSEIAAKQGRPQQALLHFQEHQNLEDSIHQMDDAEAVRHLHSLYNYQLRERENHKLILENERKERNLLLIVTISCLVCSLLFIYIQHIRRKRNQLRLKLEQVKEESFRKSSQFIAENEEKMAALEQQLKEVGSENIALRTRLEGQREIINSTNKLAEIAINRREQADTLMAYTPIYQHIREQLQQKGNAKKLFSEKDWEELETTINELYPGFIQTLHHLYPMNEHEYRVSLLIKVKIQPSHIAILTNHSNESITATRRRLYFKVHGTTGKPQDWDDFISSL